MKFLLDQDVYEKTAAVMVQWGHDVVRAKEVGLSEAGDEGILRAAQDQGRILVTRDRDFGNLVFVKRLGAGVLYLRMVPSNIDSVHAELKRVLLAHSTEELSRSFIVVKPEGHRIRRLPG